MATPKSDETKVDLLNACSFCSQVTDILFFGGLGWWVGSDKLTDPSFSFFLENS